MYESDIVGRRLAFNGTLGVFGIAAGAASSFIGICGLFAALATGVGGSLLVDGSLFLEFLPNANGALLTLLLVRLPVGQLIASLTGWGFLGTRYAADQVWRYFVYTVGAMTLFMFLYRFLLVHLFESPKFLLLQGLDEEAVAVVHGIARKNKMTWLIVEILQEIGGSGDPKDVTKLSYWEIIHRKLAAVSGERFGPIFKNRKLAINTMLLWFCWLEIGCC